MRLDAVAFRCFSLIFVIAFIGACGGAPAETETMLPAGFSERSDVPYIIGEIVERGLEHDLVRIRVRAPRNAEARVPEAIVRVSSSALMKWSDGPVASRAELRVGRRVMVWSTGPELRSLPPQVAASAILIMR